MDECLGREALLRKTPCGVISNREITAHVCCVTVNNPTVPATTGYDTLTARLFWSLLGESERDLRGGSGSVVEHGVGVGGLDVAVGWCTSDEAHGRAGDEYT